jgi:hypothetical protein
MFHFRSLSLILLSLIFLGVAAPAQAQRSDWYIKDFYTEIKLALNETVSIQEDIWADAGNLPDKHGIFRILPKSFNTPTYREELPLEILEVSNGEGDDWIYKKSQENNTWVLKIGDPNRTVSGLHHFRLIYRAGNSVQNYESTDEFAWNVLGPDWQLEIDNFKAVVVFPEGINSDNTEITISSGALDSRENSLTSWRWLDSQRLEIQSLETIKPGEGVTISAVFPKGIITPVSFPLEPINPWRPIIISAALVAIATFFAIFSWRRWGRYPIQKQTVIAEYNVPDNLSPIEVSALFAASQLSTNGLAATFVNLGVKNYLTIKQEKDRFSNKIYFKRTDKAVGPDLYFAERELLEKIFENGDTVELKKISGLSSLNLKLAGEIRQDFKKRGLIGPPLKKYSQALRLAAAVILLGSLVFRNPVVFFVALAIALIFIFLSYQTVLSLDGAMLNHKIKGFRLYLDTAEKYRSRFQEEQGELTKMLPYAIVFGLTKKWLRLMESIQQENPNSFIYPAFLIGSGNLSDLQQLASAIESVTTAVSSHVSTSTGSVGGGAGGGGGGGW